MEEINIDDLLKTVKERQLELDHLVGSYEELRNRLEAAAAAYHEQEQFDQMDLLGELAARAERSHHEHA